MYWYINSNLFIDKSHSQLVYEVMVKQQCEVSLCVKFHRLLQYPQIPPIDHHTFEIQPQY